MIRVGLPKGSVKEKSIKIIKEIIGQEISDKKLCFRNDECSIYLLKHRDIPRLIEAGLLDIGITSIEWIKENQSEVEIKKLLDWCDTKVCFIIPQENEKSMSKKLKCITEFPHLAREYFIEKKIESDIYHISGSSEACIPDLFDCCVDCVETGNTLKENNLKIKDVILYSKVAVVVRKEYKVKEQFIEKFIKLVN